MLLLRYYLWIAPHLLCGLALVVAIRKRLHRKYPAFLSLLSFAFVFELWVLWAVALLSPPRIYKWWVVSGTVVSFVLELFVLYELLGELVFSRLSTSPVIRALPRWTTAMLALLAVGSVALLPGGGGERVMILFQNLNFGLNLVASGLLFGLIAFTRLLAIPWRSIPAGIALGLGISAIVNLGAAPLVSKLGKPGYLTVDLICMIGYHICVVVWVLYLLAEKPPKPVYPDVPVSDLEAHIQELRRVVNQ